MQQMNREMEDAFQLFGLIGPQLTLDLSLVLCFEAPCSLLPVLNVKDHWESKCDTCIHMNHVDLH